MIKAALAVLVRSLGFAASVAAGPNEKAGEAYGRGDFATAFQLLRPLAEQGNASAQFNLGVMYENGQGVPRDYAEAVKWYRLAAEQGDVIALLNLGAMYGNGYGVQQDYVQAYIWFNFAAAQSNDTARKNRELVAEKMTRAQIAEAQKLAREWKPKKE